MSLASILEIVMTVLGGGLLVGAVLGWIAPLVMGIVRRRRRTGGRRLLILSAVWAGYVFCLVGAWVAFLFATQSPGPYDSDRESAAEAKVQRFDRSTYHGPVGTIRFSYKGEACLELSSVDRKQRWYVFAKDGAAVAPAGIYILEDYRITAKDKDGNTWTVKADGFGYGNVREVYVPAGSEAPLNLGPPFTATICATHDSTDTVSMEFEVEGREGELYIVERNGEQSACGFVVKSREGKTLWRGKFEAG